MRGGTAHRVPLIVGTNADEGRLFTRWLKLLPTNESMIERLLAGLEPAPSRTHHRGLPGLPGHGVPASVSAVTSHSVRRHGRSPKRTAFMRRPTGTATTMRLARCTGRGSAPPMPPNCSPSSTYTAPGSARCSPRLPTGAPRGESATTCRPGGGSSAAPGCPARVGPATTIPSVRSWCSTADPGSSTTRTPTVDRLGKASRWRHASRD